MHFICPVTQLGRKQPVMNAAFRKRRSRSQPPPQAGSTTASAHPRTCARIQEDPLTATRCTVITPDDVPHMAVQVHIREQHFL